MEQIVLWALGTGLVTGVVGSAIVFYGRRQRSNPPPDQPRVPPAAESLDRLGDRLDLVAERLDAAEYELIKARKPPSEPRSEQ